jgi:hypothetical protein
MSASASESTAAITAARHARIEEQLMFDPVVQALARDLAGTPVSALTLADGKTATFAFTRNANFEYDYRGGKWSAPKHIGAVPGAVIAVVRQIQGKPVSDEIQLVVAGDWISLPGTQLQARVPEALANGHGSFAVRLEYRTRP